MCRQRRSWQVLVLHWIILACCGVRGLDHLFSEVSVFILATLKHEDYVRDRLIPLRQTWASKFQHFYAVVGQGPEEDHFLRSHRCEEKVQYGRTIATCKITGDIPLMLTNCSNQYYGAAGPCCRNQRAAEMFFDLPRSVQWFYFADDDYFTWTKILFETLSRFDSLTPRFLSTTEMNAHEELHTSGFGYWWLKHNSNCSVPCVHSFPWSAWAVTSRGAMEVMEGDIKRGGMMQICYEFDCTHDIGQGAFLWLHGISYNFGPFALHKVRKASDFDMHYTRSPDEPKMRDFGLSIFVDHTNDLFQNSIFYNHYKQYTQYKLPPVKRSFKDGEFTGDLRTYSRSDCIADYHLFHKFKHHVQETEPNLQFPTDPQPHPQKDHVCFRYKKFLQQYFAHMSSENRTRALRSTLS